MSAEADSRKIRLLMTLRRAGISDPATLRAIEKTPRDVFVTRGFEDQAYDDRALPIECGQTISQPYIVAMMTEALELHDRAKVLEIGTGSGYQAAILSHIARRVYTIERYRTLMAEAERRFKHLKLTNIVTDVGDGGKGWPAQAPFDRIIVTAAAPGHPEALLDQLRDDGGIMVAPVGAGEVQTLIKYKKDAGEIVETKLTGVRFVPLREGIARGG